MNMTADVVNRLRATDTPTVCNALEVVMGRRTAEGFTRTPVVPLDPLLEPMVGYAATALIAASAPPGDEPAEVASLRRGYYRMIADAAARHPTVVVIEDTDDPAGVGAFWGEVNVAVHKGLGVAGAITNGSMRDLDQVDEGFQILAGSIGPSHAHVRVTAIDVPVKVLGLEVAPGDLIHADRHGAVIIGPEQVDVLGDAIDQVIDSERPILEAARGGAFDLEKLFEAWRLG
jgi:regulator of RNase E activity RraA